MIHPPYAPRLQVLVALDGSAAAATALPLARAVAAQLGAGLALLFVADAPITEAQLRRELNLDASESVSLRLDLGEPAAGILRAAAEPSVELVVLSTHGREIEPGRQMGHVAEAVVRSVGRPVLLVRPEAAADTSARPAALRRLLLPMDGTPTTAAALGPAAALASRLGATVDLLYVAAPDQAAPGERGSLGAPRYVDQPQHEWPHWAREVIDRLGACVEGWPAGVPVRSFLTAGKIGPEIARFAAEYRADAIVLVRRSRLEPGRARVLRAVLEQTPCPILLAGGPEPVSPAPAVAADYPEVENNDAAQRT
jgi:nucleotide-binding universal stress UspA family protein